MRLSVEPEAFAEAVKSAAAIARGQGVTNCVKLVATIEDALIVTGGDGDTFVELTVPATVEDPGAICTPAKVLAKAVPKLNGHILLTVDDDGALGVETLTSRLTLPTVSAAEYPTLQWPEGDPVDVTECWDRLRLIAYASAMALEPKFQAVKLLPDGWAEAYDKTRMARTEIPEGLGASVRKDSFDFAARLIEGEVSITTSANAVAFYGENVRLRAAVVQAEVVTAMLPQLAEWLAEGPSFSCDRKAFLEAVGLNEVVRDNDRQAIRVDVADGEARLTARSADIGEVTSAFPVVGAMPWVVGVTGSYVRDVLSRTTADEVTFQFGPSNIHPIVVESDGIVHMFAPNRIGSA